MYTDLIQLIERSRVAFPKIGSGVRLSVITRAETTLGVRFSESYKWWLLNYGGGQIRSDVVFGLEEGLRENEWGPDIVNLAQINKRDGLYDIGRLVFCMGNGENFLFDTSKLENGEYRVFLHDIAQNELIPYAESFAEFLQKRIREVYRISD
jgi:hypothetical protein